MLLAFFSINAEEFLFILPLRSEDDKCRLGIKIKFDTFLI